MEEMRLRKFLQDARIPEDDAEVYLSLFIQHDIEESDMADVKEEQLVKMGIKKIGHINRILKEAKKQKRREDELQHLKEEMQHLRRDLNILLRHRGLMAFAVVAG
ncbi:uncharacterized protein LOC135848068 [Planococcus citri]|uniref:uncharacterized protein LOC135848068 n=1 Tax=Planococcus citri TaxID=170843 RepID=UPI0031F86ED6